MMVLADRDTDLGPDEWWVTSQGSNGERGKTGKGKKGKWKREKKGGTFPVPSILFATREEAEEYLQEVMEESEGDEEDDEGGGVTRATTRGTGVTRKVARGRRGVRRELPGAKMRPGNPPPRRRGDLCVATRERGGGG